jgi:hypothetical protein
MTDDKIPKAGVEMVEEVLDGEGKVLYRAIHEVVEAPGEASLRAAPGAGLKTVMKKEEWFDDSFKALQQEAEDQGSQSLRAEKKEGGGGGDPVKTALEVAKFAWEFIKDNKPVVDLETASTSVLAEGTKGLSYHSARQGTSGTYQWRAYNWPVQEWTAWDIKVELAGTYQAQPPQGVTPGNYLPSVYFNVPECFVGWPHSASASAKVTNPSNIGGPNDVNAMCEVLALLNASNVTENFSKTFKFKAVGTSGFSRQ